MKPNRRRFLGLLGVGAATGPLAAKAALDETVAKQLGLSLVGAPGYASLSSSSGPPGEISAGTSLYENKIHKSLAYIKTFGIPDFVEKELRRNSKWVGALDPDIACKRSWSMSVKLQEQRQRNYQRFLDGFEEHSWSLKKKSFIKSVLGFEWPW